MLDTNAKGNLSEAMIVARLIRKGYIVSRPIGNAERYDLIADFNGTLTRIQCKTGQLVAGSVVFPVANMCRIHKTRKTYTGQIDFFAVYCDILGKVYLVPVSECGSSSKSLRVDLPANNQVAGVSFASDYEI